MGIFYIGSIACKIIWAFLVHNFEHHTQFLYAYLICRQSAATVVSGTFVRNHVIAWYLQSQTKIVGTL